MKPRADFVCSKCEEGHENLPIAATVCPDPECGGALTRLWNQAPGVISAQTKIVDRVVGPEFERNQRPRVPQEAQSQRISAGAGFNMVGPDGKHASQAYSVPTIEAAKTFGGPRPIPYRG